MELIIILDRTVDVIRTSPNGKANRPSKLKSFRTKLDHLTDHDRTSRPDLPL